MRNFNPDPHSFMRGRSVTLAPTWNKSVAIFVLLSLWSQPFSRYYIYDEKPKSSRHIIGDASIGHISRAVDIGTNMTSVEYSGHRILEAMHCAPKYTDAIYAMAKAPVENKKTRVVEFGAGDGSFVKRFCNDGHSVLCVEPDQKNQEILRSLDVSVVEDVALLPDASCSYVYTINVLEHLVNIDDCLLQIRRILQPNGDLFVFVPAFHCLWTSLDDEVGHVQRFTSGSLARFIENAGFVVQTTRYFDSLGFAAAMGIRLLERLGLFRYSRSTISFYDKYMLPVSLIGDLVFYKTLGKNVVLLAKKR